MTFRELIDLLHESGDDDAGLQAGFAVMQVLRTVDQREPAALDGCCASLRAFIDQRGAINRVTLTRFLTDAGMVNLEIPNELLRFAFVLGDERD